MTPAHQATPRLRQGRLAATTLIVLLVLGEFIARLVLPEPAGVAGAALHEQTPAHPEQSRIYVSTPAGRRLHPNADVLIERHLLSGQPVRLRTNRLGYRNPDIGEKTGSRILFLGDSITFADYLPEEQTFVRLIGAAAYAEGLSWETINAGVGGIDTRTELAILRETGLALQPDVVVLCHYLNDHLESPAINLSEMPAAFRASWLLTRAWMTAAGVRQTRRHQAIMETSRRAFHEHLAREYTLKGMPIPPLLAEAAAWFADWGAAWSPPTWDITRDQLTDFAALAKTSGFTPLVVSFPVSLQVYVEPADDYPQRQLERICADLELPFLDLLPLFRGLAQEGGPALFYDQCHHTPEGSRIAAEAIFGMLREPRNPAH